MTSCSPPSRRGLAAAVLRLTQLARPVYAFAGGVRIGAMAARPSPVLPDGMDQPCQRINVDIIEPAGREAHHVLLFAPARAAARPHGQGHGKVLN